MRQRFSSRQVLVRGILVCVEHELEAEVWFETGFN